jgi:hypothetical protein
MSTDYFDRVVLREQRITDVGHFQVSSIHYSMGGDWVTDETMVFNEKDGGCEDFGSYDNHDMVVRLVSFILGIEEEES